jgi:CHAT domain-containing protein/Tfp pilus assembly protein PilF
LRAARWLAEAYAQVWMDSFPLHQVDQFVSWSPTRREQKVVVDSLRRAGNRAFARSGFGPAARLWRASLERATVLPDTAGIAAALGNIGAGFYRAGQLDSAELYLVESRNLAEKKGDRRTALNALVTLGSVSKDRGDLRLAQQQYNQALTLRERIGDFSGLAADHNNLGLIAEELGDLEAAQHWYERSLTLARSHDLPEAAATALVNLGNLATRAGDYQVGIAHYRQALAHYRSIGNRADVAFVLRSVGLLETRRGDYAAATARLRESVTLYAQTGPPLELAGARRDLAAALSAMGSVREALNELRRAGEGAPGGPIPAGELASLALSRADLALQLNDFAQAEHEYGRAEALFLAARDPGGRASALEGRGRLWLIKGDTVRAFDVLGRSAALAEAEGDTRQAALIRLIIGAAQAARDDTPAARATLTGAREALRQLSDPVGEAAALGELGRMERAGGNRFAAESLYREGLARLGRRSAPGVSWQLHEGLGRTLADEGAQSPAAVELQAAVADIEAVAYDFSLEDRRAAYRADKWGAYAALARIDLGLGRIGDAFGVSERLRARGMLDLLARGRVAEPLDSSGPLARREQDLRRRIAELTRRLESSSEAGVRGSEDEGAEASVTITGMLDRAQAEYAQLLSEMRERSPEYAAAVIGETEGWKSVASRLEPTEVLIEYLLDDLGGVAFVVRRDTLVALTLDIGRAELAELVDFARSTIVSQPGAAQVDAWKGPLRRLNDRLIRPVEAAGLLTHAERLVIVPYAELHYLPFAALIDGDHDDRYLIQRFEVVYAPSASVWVRLRNRSDLASQPQGILAAAPRASALPGTGAEVGSIRRLFGDRATLLLGAAASETAFRRAVPEYGIVHLASRGVLNKQNPLFSYIQLVSGGEDDGRLEVHEVFGLALAARLVVLSACETGLGSGALADVPAGDDWVGLTRAFLLAGADNVLATLWQVDDRATARLMNEFYRSLTHGEDAASALATAQRRLLATRGTATPLAWAGFALVGAGETRSGSR